MTQPQRVLERYTARHPEHVATKFVGKIGRCEIWRCETVVAVGVAKLLKTQVFQLWVFAGDGC